MRNSLSSFFVRERRPLTEGEIQLARAVFGSTLDYGLIRLQRGGLLSLYAGAVTIQDTIYFNVACYETDFAHPRVRLTLQALLIHELMHVWQYQNLSEYHWCKAGLEHISHFGRVYDYEFRRDSEALHTPGDSAQPVRQESAPLLLNFRYEQQGRIMQDYYMLKNLGRDVSLFEKIIGKTFLDARFVDPKL